MRKILFIHIFIVVFVMIHSPLGAAQVPVPDFSFLSKLLIDKGFDPAYVRDILIDPRIHYNNEIVISNLNPATTLADEITPREVAKPKTSTQPFVLKISPKYIDKGRDFIDSRQKEFAELEERYGVGPKVITAILIVESRLGKYYEKYGVFNAYLNLAACLDPDHYQYICAINKDSYPGLTQEKTMRKAIRKGEWALNELCHLMKLAQQIDMEPLELRGSYAGAIGPAQFIPSSFMNYGIDGNLDGVRDPFEMQDALGSIANYLKMAGWQDDADLKLRRRAIWAYNHSSYYVDTVMALYEKLGKG